MADMLKGMAQRVMDVLSPSDTNPEKKAEELSEFAKDVSGAASSEQQDTQQADQAASKQATGDKYEKLSSDIEKNLGKSHLINVPSHERMEAPSDIGAPEPDTKDTQAAPTSADQTEQIEKNTVQATESEKNTGQPRESEKTGTTHLSPRKEGFEARTYQMAAGAESPDGNMQKLHLHEQKGAEFEGAPLAGRSEPFEAPAHGGRATTSQEDRPVKLTMGHDYKHERRDQQQEGSGEGTTGGADASRMSMDTGGEPAEGLEGETAAVSGAGGADESRMSMEGGGQMATDITKDTGVSATTETTGNTETTDMGGDAAAGMSPHKKDFEAETNAEAKGAETPDGPVEKLHLHAYKGAEGAGSKADQQLQRVLEQGVPSPPVGSGAPTSEQDPPDKMMAHRKEESGVAGRAGATESSSLTGAVDTGAQQTLRNTDTSAPAEATSAPPEANLLASATESGMSLDGDAAAGAVPHKKDFETETNSEAKGAETPDGPLEKLHLHADKGSEGAGSKADQQLQKVLEAGAPTPPAGAGASTSEQDPPDKMGPHHREEAGAAARGTSGTEAQKSGTDMRKSGNDAQKSGTDTGAATTQRSAGGTELVDSGRVIKSEGLSKLAEAVAAVEGTAPEKVVHKPEEKKEEAQKSEKMLKEGHEHPYVSQPGDQEDVPEALQRPAQPGTDAPSVKGAGARQAALDVAEPAAAQAYPDTGRTPTGDMTGKEGVDAPAKGASATVGGLKFELGTITDAAIDTSGPKDYPENMAA